MNNVKFVYNTTPLNEEKVHFRFLTLDSINAHQKILLRTYKKLKVAKAQTDLDTVVDCIYFLKAMHLRISFTSGPNNTKTLSSRN
jgi:hypothetical protein